MRFGFIIPNNWGLEDPQDVVAIAVEAEQLGFHSVWVNHHVLHAGYILDRLGDRPYYDALTVLTYVAALTRDIRLGTSVLVLPYLNPISLAKTLATLDILCTGRLTLGVGVGMLRSESDALGSDFSRRGAYADESIEVMKELWTQETPSFDGSFYTFSGMKFSPKPLQKPHPPIWIGGSSRAALRRAARLGDGWHPTGLSPEDVAGHARYLEAQVEAAGRNMSEIRLSVRVELEIMDSPQTGPQGPITGTPEQLVSAIEAYAEVGVSEIVLSVSTADVDRIRRSMDSFAEAVIPLAGG